MIGPRASLLTRFLVCLGVVVALGLCGGRTSSELGAFEDEPAHVVTALMIHDWLTTFEPLHPVRFAEDYYVHYPKVAVGQWPPVYHGLLALWMLVFGASKLAVLAFNWVLVALTAALIGELALGEVSRVAPVAGRPHRGTNAGPFRTGVSRAGLVFATTTGLIYVALPLVQDLGGGAMLEVLVGLFGTLGALAFGRWMEAPGVARALAFAGCAALTILTKGSGLAFAFVPMIALVLARRPRLALAPSLWLVPVAVGLVCGPWYLFSIDQSRSSWNEGTAPGAEFVARALQYYPRELVVLGGGLFLVLVLFGVWAHLGARRASGSGGSRADAAGGSRFECNGRERSAAYLAWPLALGCLHCVVPSSLEARHLVAAAPLLVVFGALGAHALIGRAVAFGAVMCAGTERRLVTAAMLIGLVFAVQGFRIEPKEERGFAALARAVQERPELEGRAVLVVSGAAGEGLGVLALALTDHPRRSRQVLRASKVLARSSWIGADYEPRFSDARTVRRWLESVSVAAVVFDDATPARHRRAHVELVRAALASEGSPWRLVRRFDRIMAGEDYPGALELWVAPELATRPQVTLGLNEVLSRFDEDIPELAQDARR